MAKQVIDIEDLLVWAYKEHAVDEIPDRIGGPRCARMSFNVAVDFSDTAEEPPEDAFMVNTAVRRLPKTVAAMLIGHAKTATRPDCFPGAKLVMVPVLNQRGGVAGIFDDQRNRMGSRVICAIELEDRSIMEGWDASALVAVRDLYSEWVSGLLRLTIDLRGKLEGYEVTGPGVDPAPWTQNVRVA